MGFSLLTLAFIYMAAVIFAEGTSPLASLMMDPNKSQFRENESFSISCVQFGPGDWTVWRYTTVPAGQRSKVSCCGPDWGTTSSSGCTLTTLKDADSGVYWCESKHRDSSNAVSITVTKPVVLESPALPVKEGDDVTLICQHETGPQLQASFYKDGSPIDSEAKDRVTLRKVSRSSEGAYKCEVNNKISPVSWILIKGVSKPASLSMTPDSSQVLEYGRFSLSCGINSSDQGWTVKRSSLIGNKLSSCVEGWGTSASFGCEIKTAKTSDSAIYWCESPSKQRSNSVLVTVSGGVILESPAIPVESGSRVTLRCKTMNRLDLPATFYKDGENIRNESTGHMMLDPVSTSDEGSYQCIINHVKSKSSSLFVRAPEPSSSPPFSALLCVVLHVAAWSMCIYPTYRLIRHRLTARRTPPAPVRTSKPRQEAAEEENDVSMNPVTTDYHF